MKIVITDVSVFFDVYHIRALPEFFALDLEVLTTDFVAREILQEKQKAEFEIFIRSKKLTVLRLSPDEVEEVKAFKTKRFFKTLPDKTVLWKAKQLGCILLTGDKKLRNEAEDQKIEVHGSIWVVQRITEAKLITAATGIKLFEKLKEVNDGLPKEEIEGLIRKLKG